MTDLLWIYIAALIVFSVLVSRIVDFVIDFVIDWVIDRFTNDEMKENDDEPVKRIYFDEVDDFPATGQDADPSLGIKRTSHFHDQLTEEIDTEGTLDAWKRAQEYSQKMMEEMKERSIEREIKRLLK